MQPSYDPELAIAAFGDRDPLAVPASRGRRAALAVVRALAAPVVSLDALRRAVIRYGAAARDLALAPDEMAAELAPLVRRVLERRGDDTAVGELQSYVQWWAIHGYHRAD